MPKSNRCRSVRRTPGTCKTVRIGGARSTHVPFLELAPVYQELREQLDEAAHRVLERGWYVLGPEVEAFEREFAQYCGVDHCVGVGNGLEALTLILRALEIGPGDEVIVPGNTYIATWLAVSHTGATPVPVDPVPGTHQIDPELVTERVTPKTRAILAVHLYGMPADMTRLRDVADEHGLHLLEDAAQAHGATLGGQRCGALGDAAGFSFYPTKNLGCFGDGGAVTTNDSALADRVRLLRNYGSPVKNTNELRGYNSRLDELQAAFLRVRLAVLDDWNARRRRLAERYLSDLPEAIPEAVGPDQTSDANSAWHIFAIRHEERDRIAAGLADRGIGTLIHYPTPPHRSRAYSDASFPPLPISERLADQVLSLPIGPHLAEAAQDEVIAALRAVSAAG